MMASNQSDNHLNCRLFGRAHGGPQLHFSGIQNNDSGAGGRIASCRAHDIVSAQARGLLRGSHLDVLSAAVPCAQATGMRSSKRAEHSRVTRDPRGIWLPHGTHFKLLPPKSSVARTPETPAADAIAYTQPTCSTVAMPTPQSSVANTMDKPCSSTWQTFTATQRHKPGNKI
jgi:hypothetical protein